MGQATIEILEDIVIVHVEQPLLHLVKFVYPGYMHNLTFDGFFNDGAILCPTIECLDEVNEFILSLILEEEVSYLSSDTPCQFDQQENAQVEWFTNEFLNDIKCSGIPNHCVKLKVGVPIMLLRNIDQDNGLCNRTRFNSLGEECYWFQSYYWKNIGDNIFIPRMNLIFYELSLPFKFQRRQFTISLCFAMTINKSQGFNLSHIIFLFVYLIYS